MPKKADMKFPTVAKGGRMDATKGRHTMPNSGRGRGDGWMPQKAEIKFPKLAEGGRMDATKDRNNISNSGSKREGGCQKRQT